MPCLELIFAGGAILLAADDKSQGEVGCGCSSLLRFNEESGDPNKAMQNSTARVPIIDAALCGTRKTNDRAVAATAKHPLTC